MTFKKKSQTYFSVCYLPWEQTQDFIRSGHRDSSEFEPDSLRTIWISEEEGVKAVVGKPKGKDTMEVVSYLFLLDRGWTLEKAKAWFQEHHQEPRHEHLCCLTPILEKIVDKPLKIRGIALTAGMSRNLNIYMDRELEQFASKLVGSSVYLEHVSALNAVGKVTNTVWDSNSKTLFYEAEIYDEETQQKIRKGLIQHVSVAADYERIDILDGKAPHGLHNAELSLVAVPGIPQTNIRIMERLGWNSKKLCTKERRVKERIWTHNYINNLPDSAFAIILPGDRKDETGRIVPRTLRKFPHHNMSGAIDLPHLRNANARVPQSEIPEEYKQRAMRHLAAHKRQVGIGMVAEEARLLEEQEEQPGEVEFEVAPEPSIDDLIVSVEEVVDQINEALEALTLRVQALEEQGRVKEAKRRGQAVIAPEAFEGQDESFDLSKVPLRDVMRCVS